MSSKVKASTALLNTLDVKVGWKYILHETAFYRLSDCRGIQQANTNTIMAIPKVFFFCSFFYDRCLIEELKGAGGSGYNSQKKT